MRPIYLKLFSVELLLEPVHYSTISYIRESDTERELQLGKLRLLISTTTKSKANKLVFESL